MADEAANQKRVEFFFVHSSDLDAVKLDDDEKVDGAETLLELFQAPIADACLEALRRMMSMTYFESLERTSELCVRDIRAFAIKPLCELGKEFQALKLPSATRIGRSSMITPRRSSSTTSCRPRSFAGGSPVPR